MVIPRGIFRNEIKVVLIIKNLLPVNYLVHQKVLNNLNVCEFPGIPTRTVPVEPLGDKSSQRPLSVQ